LDLLIEWEWLGVEGTKYKEQSTKLKVSTKLKAPKQKVQSSERQKHTDRTV
jgi:hypothetical protein